MPDPVPGMTGASDGEHFVAANTARRPVEALIEPMAENQRRARLAESGLEHGLSLSGQDRHNLYATRTHVKAGITYITELEGPPVPDDQLGRLYSGLNFIAANRTHELIPPIPDHEFGAAYDALETQLGGREFTPVRVDRRIGHAGRDQPAALEVDWHGAPVGINAVPRSSGGHYGQGRHWADIEAQQVDGHWYVSNGDEMLPVTDKPVYFGRTRPANIEPGNFVHIRPRPGRHAVSLDVSRVHGWVQAGEDGRLHIEDRSTNGTQIMSEHYDVAPAGAKQAAETLEDAPPPQVLIDQALSTVMSRERGAQPPQTAAIAAAAEQLDASQLGTQDVIRLYNQLGWLMGLPDQSGRVNRKVYDRVWAARQRLWDSTFQSPPQLTVNNRVAAARPLGLDATGKPVGEPVPATERFDWQGAPLSVSLMSNAVDAAEATPYEPMTVSNYVVFAQEDPRGRRWFVRATHGEGAAEITEAGLAVGRADTPDHPQLDVAAQQFRTSAQHERGGEMVGRRHLRLRREPNGQLAVDFLSVNPAVVCEDRYLPARA